MTIRKGKREGEKEKDSKKVDEQMKKVKKVKKVKKEKSIRNDLQKRRDGEQKRLMADADRCWKVVSMQRIQMRWKGRLKISSTTSIMGRVQL
jgi:hypothetical protein